MSTASLFLQRALFVFFVVGDSGEAGGEEMGDRFSFGLVELKPRFLVQYFGTLE